MDFDFQSAVFDEVALEGLDGITLSMLWIRLQNRPRFYIAIDDDSKVFLWNCIAVHNNISIYELPTSRKLVPIYNRYEHIDSEFGVVLERSGKIIDPYPIAFVNDDNIRGSCSTYKSRVCITSEIRNANVLLKSLNEVIEKWGEKLVLVASPKARYLSLTGSEIIPHDMPPEEYCLLERIGRSRYLGEVTQGVDGLLSLKAPFTKQLHYYRKKLTLRGFVTKQAHIMKNSKGRVVSGSLFHVTKFFVLHRTKMEEMMKSVCVILKEKPQNRELLTVLRDQLCVNAQTFRKLLLRLSQKSIKIDTVLYKDFYPEATAKERLYINGKDRIVKVVQLLAHCDEVNNVEDEDNSEQKNSLPLNVYFDCSKLYYDLPLKCQVYRCIQDAGSEGLSSADIGRILTLPKLDVRSLLNTLIEEQFVLTFLRERGRQKQNKYVAKNIFFQGEIREKQKLIQKKLVADEFQESRKLKRSHPDSPENADRLASKKAKRDHVEVILQEGNLNTQESFNHINCKEMVPEIKDCDVFAGKAPKLISLSEKSVHRAMCGSKSKLTDRHCKRIQMILDNLKSVGLSTFYDLYNYLINKEEEEGYNFKLDNKSLKRMVYKMCKEKKLKIFIAVLGFDKQEKEYEFICDNSVEQSDSCIQFAIEQVKFKKFNIYREEIKIEASINECTTCDENKINVLDEKNIHEGKKSRTEASTFLLAPKISVLQAHPKCLRFKAFHKFLFYLVYNYEGHSCDNSLKPVVYHNSMTWKRFISPLPADRKEGWCFLTNIYARMPLSIFVQIFNLRHKIKDFVEYLEDEEKCHYPITYLPSNLYKKCLNNRRYFYVFDDILKCLCFMGLITFGRRISFAKEHVYLYIHKKAALKDTTISPPSYNHINCNLPYEKKIFILSTLDDVENFWNELESVCLNTPLRKFYSIEDNTIVIAGTSDKPELMEALKSRNPDDIIDVGHIPGDGLGAAGFDSLLYLHFRRNWQFLRNIFLQNLFNQKEALKQKSSRLQKLDKYCSPQKDKTSKSVIPSAIPKQNTRIIEVHTKRIQKRYLDEKDKAARLPGPKCEWFAKEDTFLLLCKVASLFLNPTSKSLVVDCRAIRDLLQEKFPEVSRNKSSLACLRRVRLMMTNPTTADNVSELLGEARLDKDLVKEFYGLKQKITNKAAGMELFTTVLKRLYQKFTLPAVDRCQKVSLPNTVEVFNKTFEIASIYNVFHQNNNHKDPECEDEVKYSTLYSLIVSSVATTVQDKKDWSHLLHKLYQVYPDYVLKAVFSRLRSKKVIAVKTEAGTNLQYLLLSTLPCHFSNSYVNTVSTKFQKLFNESKELIDILKCINKNGLELKDDFALGYVPAILALVLLDELQLTVQVPEHVISLNTSLSIEAKSTIIDMINKSDGKICVELSGFLNKEKDLLHNGKENTHSISKNLKDTSADQSEHGRKKLLENDTYQTNKVHNSSSASRFELFVLRQELSQSSIEKVQGSPDYIVLNPCKVFCNLKANANPTLSNKNITVSQNVLHLPMNSTESSMKTLTEGCISEIKELFTAFIPSEAFTEGTNFYESLENIYVTHSSQTLGDAKSIFEEIMKANVVGISEKNLWRKFKVLNGELSIFEHLHLFRRTLLVIRAGVASFVYVCMRFAKSWVLTSYLKSDICCKSKLKEKKVENVNCSSSRNVNDCEMMKLQENCSSSKAIDNSWASSNEDISITCQDMCPDSLTDQITLSNASLQHPFNNSTKEVHFLSRTWRHPDGTLNKSVFIELLQTILSYIINSPGVNTSHVTDHFSLPLQPIQTLELLEILEKAFCIVKYYCKNRPKAKLFSSHVNIFITKNPGPDDFDHLESLPSAVFNLARLEALI